MDDRSRHGSTFLDDDLDLDFDLGPFDEDEHEHSPSPRSGADGPYKPARLRSAPNWTRIATAGFVVIVFLFIVVFGVKSWMGHRKAAAYEQYFAQVSDVTQQSNSEGEELANLLSQPTGADRAQLVGRLETLAGRSKGLVADTRGIETPAELRGSHEWLVTTMEYRHNGLVGMQQAMSTALGAKDQEAAAVAVAHAAQRLEASDVIYSDSFAANARETLAEQKLTGVTVPESVFVTDPEFGSVKAMVLMLERLASGGAPTGKGKKPEKINDGRIRGGALVSTTVIPSGETLSPGGVTQLTGSEGLSFEVSFTNQGEVQSTQVPVSITFKGDNVETIEVTGEIESIDPGQTASVKVPLGQVPKFGQTLDMAVMVGPVPGEKILDNNAATYQVMFKL